MKIITYGEGGGSYVRQLTRGKEVLSCFKVRDFGLRFGTTEVRAAGIGGVRTAEKHRGKGHMRTLMEETLRYLKKENYHISVLFGIPDFYTKFGYAPCLPEYKLTVSTRDAEEAEVITGKYRKRKIQKSDIGELIKIYNENNRSRTGSIVRTAETFPWFRRGSGWSRQAEGFFIKDGDEINAYSVFDRSSREVNVVEIGYRKEECFPVLLHEFVKMALRRRCEHINFFMPADHPFAQYLHRYGCELVARYLKSGGGMARILNQRRLMEDLIPEFRTLPVAEESFSLFFKTELGETSVAAGGKSSAGRPRRMERYSLELPQRKLAQLLFGCRCTGDILNDPEVKFRGNRELLPWNFFFFGSIPYMWMPDRF